MSRSSPRFSFLTPSAGDKLLARATSCKLEFSRWPAEPPVRDSDDDATAATIAAEHDSHRAAHCEVSFELKGELRAGAEAAELLRAIAREFTQPPRGKGGAA